jgi:hypothetical protein
MVDNLSRWLFFLSSPEKRASDIVERGVVRQDGQLNDPNGALEVHSTGSDGPPGTRAPEHDCLPVTPGQALQHPLIEYSTILRAGACPTGMETPDPYYYNNMAVTQLGWLPPIESDARR